MDVYKGVKNLKDQSNWPKILIIANIALYGMTIKLMLTCPNGEDFELDVNDWRYNQLVFQAIRAATDYVNGKMMVNDHVIFDGAMELPFT